MSYMILAQNHQRRHAPVELNGGGGGVDRDAGPQDSLKANFSKDNEDKPPPLTMTVAVLRLPLYMAVHGGLPECLAHGDEIRSKISQEKSLAGVVPFMAFFRVQHCLQGSGQKRVYTL